MLDFPQDDSASSAARPLLHRDPSLSVVVPVHDEVDNVIPLVAELRAALDGVTIYELVFVDDGSSDGTADRLAIAAAERPPGSDGALRLLRHRAGCGQSTAVHSGVLHARGRWVATMDGDGQNDPADIPRLLARLTAPDRPARLAMVAGWRTRRRDGWFVRLSSRIANSVRGSLLGDSAPDTGCGLKVFERDLFLRLPYFDHMHRFLPALARRAGAEVESVPVNHRRRVHGLSHYGLHNRLWVGIVDLFGVVWLIRRARLPEFDYPDGTMTTGPAPSAAAAAIVAGAAGGAGGAGGGPLAVPGWQPTSGAATTGRRAVHEEG